MIFFDVEFLFFCLYVCMYLTYWYIPSRDGISLQPEPLSALTIIEPFLKRSNLQALPGIRS